LLQHNDTLPVFVVERHHSVCSVKFKQFAIAAFFPQTLAAKFAWSFVDVSYIIRVFFIVEKLFDLTTGASASLASSKVQACFSSSTTTFSASLCAQPAK